MNSPHPYVSRQVEALLRSAAMLTLVLIPLDNLALPFGLAAVRGYMIPGVVIIIGSSFLCTYHRVSTLVVSLAINSFVVALSLLWTTSFSDSLTTAVGQCYLFLLLQAIIKLWSADILNIGDFNKAALIGTTISAVAAVVQVVTYALLGINIGVWTDMTNVPFPRPDGLTREPIWAAVNATVGLGLTLSYAAISASRRRALCVLFGLVIIMTFSRAAILPLLLLAPLLVLYQLLSRRGVNRQLRATQLLALVAGIVAVGGLTSVVVPASALSRFNVIGALGSDNVDVDQGSLSSRLGVQQLILDNWTRSPIFGHGAGAIAIAVSDPANRLRYAGGGELNVGRGSTNFELTMLWDLGLVGLVSAVLVVGAALVIVVRLRPLNLGLCLATFSIIIQYQFSNGFRLGISWLLFAWISLEAMSARGATLRSEIKGDGAHLRI